MTLNNCTAQSTPALSAREVCQTLREAIFGRRTLTRLSRQSWDEIHEGHFQVEIEGWRLTLYNHCNALGHCETCTAADGRHWSLDSGDRFGTDPVALLSTWEHQTLEQLFKNL
jgi:probable phosphoglycerate mutase